MAIDPAKKAELNYAWRLKFWELIIDKVMLAAIVSVGLFIGNLILSTYTGLITSRLDDHRDQLTRETGVHLEKIRAELTRDLEEHRNHLAIKHFVAQKRFDAIEDIITAYNDLFALYVVDSRAGESTKETRESYRQAINAVFKAHNHKELIIPRAFSTQLEKLGFLHRGVMVNKFDVKYTSFLVDLGDQFSQMGRDAIDPPLAAKPATYFILAELPSPAERKDNQAAARYLDTEVKRWQSWKKTATP